MTGLLTTASLIVFVVISWRRHGAGLGTRFLLNRRAVVLGVAVGVLDFSLSRTLLGVPPAVLVALLVAAVYGRVRPVSTR